MPLDINEMGRAVLIQLWTEAMDDAPPSRLSSPFLRRFIAFELQSKQLGGLSRSFVKRIAQIDGAKVRSKSPQLKQGGRLIRQWNGVTHIVDVTDQGFVWQGQHYRSLSAIARAITGAHWSGPRFFGIKGR